MDKRRGLATRWARRPLACALSVALALAATPTTALADDAVEVFVEPGTEYDVEHNGEAIDGVEATDKGCALEVRVEQSAYDSVGVSVTGDVSLSSTPATDWSNARALWVNNRDGESANVTVGGDVTAEAPAEAYGLYQEYAGSTTVSVKGNVVATSKRDIGGVGVGVNQVAADSGPHVAEVGGNVVATGSGEVGVAEGMCLRGSGDGGNTVLVLGDVTATGSTLGTGLIVNGGAPATVLVAGTLSGSHVGIAVEGRDEGVSGIDVTVWKIAVGEGGELFYTGMQEEAADAKGSFVQTLAKNINYILKVNQSAGGQILAVGANGQTRSYDAATL